MDPHTLNALMDSYETMDEWKITQPNWDESPSTVNPANTYVRKIGKKFIS